MIRCGDLKTQEEISPDFNERGLSNEKKNNKTTQHKTKDRRSIPFSIVVDQHKNNNKFNPPAGLLVTRWQKVHMLICQYLFFRESGFSTANYSRRKQMQVIQHLVLKTNGI